jgi:hypothetical protein
MHLVRDWPLLALITCLTAHAASPGEATAQSPPLPEGSPVPLMPAEAGAPTFAARVLPDPETGRLSALWRVGFVAGEETAEEVAFVLASGMEVHRVEGERVRGFRALDLDEGAPFRTHLVELEGIRPGDGVELEFAYSGPPHAGSDGMARLDEGWIELMLDAFWFPLFASFDQQMRGTLRIHLPEAWTVISGAPTRFEEGAHVVDFPVPGVDAHFAAAPALERLEAEGFVLLHRGADPGQVALVLEAARDCSSWLNSRFGRDNPLRDMRIVITEREQVAYHRDNFISVDGGGFDSLQDAHTLFCHEMAHHWARSAGFMSPDHWMSEAFAEYEMARFVRARHGVEAFESMIARWEEAGRSAGPVWTPELAGRPSFVLMYRRAPVLLARLEERIGEEAFGRFVERYMTEGVVRTEALLQVLAQVAGDGARRWFQGELERGPGG